VLGGQGKAGSEMGVSIVDGPQTAVFLCVHREIDDGGGRLESVVLIKRRV
jgi:hypothetical protein